LLLYTNLKNTKVIIFIRLKLKKHHLLFFLFFYALVSFGQQKLNISYGETINLKKVDETTKFHISSDSGEVNLKGFQINEYKFETPGQYLIKIEQAKSNNEANCEHSLLPNEIQVNVSSIKMKFDGNRIEFSQPIKKGIETTGIILSIPISIETYDNKPVALNYASVTTAGIGTSITANLSKDYGELSVGENIISYSLKGTVTENTYLMFDFVDANNKVQSVALQSTIEN
jgi:hypothetical protein